MVLTVPAIGVPELSGLTMMFVVDVGSTMTGWLNSNSIALTSGARKFTGCSNRPPVASESKAGGSSMDFDLMTTRVKRSVAGGVAGVSGQVKWVPAVLAT